DNTMFKFWLFARATCNRGGTLSIADKRGANKIVSVNRMGLSVRIFLWSLVNVLTTTFLVLSIPLLLSTAETHLDFVLNAAASIFIIELDDIEPKKCVAIE
ncbi:hypothetical protein EMIHUDRAFT_372633, partial [Emiliania huxleyi CCMP1516]